MEPLIETKRLVLREMSHDDRPPIEKILQDPEVMIAYEGPSVSKKSLVGSTNSCNAIKTITLACG